MKKSLLSIFVFLCLFFPSQSTAALLIYNDYVHDDVSDLYWVRNLSMTNDLTFQEQLEFIDAINILNLTDWHMASLAEIETLWYGNSKEQIEEAFLPSRSWSTPGDYFGRYNESPYPGFHYMASIYNGSGDAPGMRPLDRDPMPDDTRDYMVGAWITLQAQSVPVPSTSILLCIGLLALTGMYRRIRS